MVEFSQSRSDSLNPLVYVDNGDFSMKLSLSRTQEHRYETILEQIPEKARTVLDVGCARHSSRKRGKGNLHAFLVDRLNEASVRGIDILPDEVAKMRAEGFNVEVANAQTFSFDDEFDAIIAGELIEHLPNPGAFIENAVSHLAPDGRLVLSTPNPDGFVFFRKALFGQTNNPTHTCWIDPKNLRALCQAVQGARLVSVSYLPPTGGISSLLWRLERRRAASPTYVASIEPEPETTETR